MQLRTSIATLVLLALSTPLASAQGVALLGSLQGNQVVPPTSSAGVGTIGVVIDPVANTLTYDIALHTLSGVETAAGIYGYAGPGGTGALVYDLGLGFQLAGVWNYPEADEASILAGLAYVRVDSTGNPAGDLRAQLVPSSADAVLMGPLEQAQVVPPSGFFGSWGMAVFELDTASNTATYEVTMGTTNIPINMYLRGYVPAGQYGGVLAVLPSSFHYSGTWSYPEEDEAQLLNGLTFVNLFTFKGQELRGQMNAVTGSGAQFERYCPAGLSSNGCQAILYGSGTPSASQAAGFQLHASAVPGLRNGIFFFGTQGRQQNSWGNGTSFQCIVPPVTRAGLMAGHGTATHCDGSFALDLNAHWSAKPAHNPGAGALLQAQLWYRDPQNTSNQSTSLSDAIEFLVLP